MKKTMMKSVLLTLFMAAMFLFGVSLAKPAGVEASGLKKPTFVRASTGYINNKICLRWLPVKGAKKYEIYRAKVNTKNGKAGKKWKRWASTKNPFIIKGGAGDYRYRVRAVKGSKKGKWSYGIRIFGATAYITNTVYDPPVAPIYFYGVPFGGRPGKITFRVLVANKTHSQMGFVQSGSRFGPQSTIYALNSAGQAIKKWPGDLYIAEIGGYAKQVNPGKTSSLYFQVEIPLSEWNTYKNCKFMVTSSFYPNPYTEPMATQMAIACTTNIANSALAGK